MFRFRHPVTAILFAVLVFATLLYLAIHVALMVQRQAEATMDTFIPAPAFAPVVAGESVECFEDGSGIYTFADGSQWVLRNEDPTHDCYDPMLAD